MEQKCRHLEISDLLITIAEVPLSCPPSASGKEIGFTTGPNGYTMTDALIRLDVGGATNLPAVSLYSGGSTGSTTTAPTTLVANFTNPASFTYGTPTNYTFTLSSPVVLAPNTTYWVAVQSTGSATQIGWPSGSPSVAYSGSDEVSYSLLYGYSGSSPTTWTTTSTTLNWMQVEGYETVWRIGLNNGTSSEFGSSTNETVPSTYTIPSNWATITDWSTSGWPGGLAQTNTVGGTSGTAWTSQITYNLASVPAGGAIFTLQPSDAYPYPSQIAVSSNGTPCGVLQIVGSHNIGGNTYTDVYLRPYQIYIPKEFLTTGSNTITLARLATLGLPNNWLHSVFAIDYLQLDGLPEIPADPIHSKFVQIGLGDGDGCYRTLSAANGGSLEEQHGGMTYAADGVNSSEQLLQEWMGCAYSNNPAGAGFWCNNAWEQDYGTMSSFLTILKNLNMTVFAPCLSCEGTGGHLGHAAESAITTSGSTQGPYLTANGTAYQTISGGDEGILNNFNSHFANQLHMYYLCNEPCQQFSDVDLSYAESVATYAKSQFTTLKIMCPGYAYGGGYGDPVNWDGGDSGNDNDAAGWSGIQNRAALDDLCDTIGGHAFGTSYCVDHGNLVETINSDGTGLIGSTSRPPAGTTASILGDWPKPFIVTECGSTDTIEMGFFGTYEYSEPLDICLRAHVGFADYFCVADAFGNGPYDFLNGTDYDSSTWSARPAGGYLQPTVATATASGSTTLVLTNAAEVIMGEALGGTGIVGGTTVTAINTSTNTITLSTATNAAIAQYEILSAAAGVPLEPGLVNVVTSGSTPSGSSTITLSAPPSFQVGTQVQQVGISNPCTVTAISGNTVTISTPTYATIGTGTTLITYDVVAHEPTVTKVQLIRRLALAYATHGEPLPYVYGTTATNAWPLVNTAPSSPLVYFRAVNTATLAPLPNNGATSNKLLLSFVNFDENNSGSAGTHTVSVSVVMPKPNYTYTGVRYGAGNTLAAARSTTQTWTTDNNGVLNATETLPFGEAVEYILNP